MSRNINFCPRFLLCTAALACAFLTTQAQSLYTVSAPAGDGTSTGLRVPNGTREHAFHRTALHLSMQQLNQIPAGTTLTHLGFEVKEGADVAVLGNLKIYLLNTIDGAYNLQPRWADIISPMALVYDGPFTVPDSAGPVDMLLSGSFVYTGQGLYVGYDFQTSGPYAAKNAVYASSVSVPSSIRSGFSPVSPPDELTDDSDFRPVLRFGFPLYPIGWRPLTTSITESLSCLDIFDDSTAWVSSANGAVYRTTNRGTTWLAAGNVGRSPFAIAVLGKRAALVAVRPDSASAKFLRTLDGGSSWSESTIPGSFSVAIPGKSSSSDLMVITEAKNDTVLILTSDDWGYSWSASPERTLVLPGGNVRGGSLFRSGSTFWFAASSGGEGVYRSVRGINGPWTLSPVPRPEVVALAFSSDQGRGFAAHRSGEDTLSTSTDGGKTWQSSVVHGMGLVNSLEYFPGGTDAWAVGTTGIWHTSDGGGTWERVYSVAGTTESLTSVRFFPNFQGGLAIGSNGTILRGTWITNGVLSSAANGRSPAAFWLKPNYPNPFNSSTVVEFFTPRRAAISLRVFDLLGRELAVLVSGEHPGGLHRIRWDAAGLSSGVYVIRLGVDHSFSATKALLLR